ncbi:pseudo histidine-containing phosphotransfer protein 5-like [Lotus japonicus]|uniref:pseudo histidine-containing phosphotransfer protein 5-like n=1 Tax=Lotus japonicus TaxID=34305 RepID=UPI0025895BF9|nr:pseudo histidine-containing phosphotransfer protein 5-like [Lotus japonicus]
MESSDDLQKKIAMMKQSFFDEGFLDPTQFQQLENLQDKEMPNFLKDVFSLYFMDATRKYAEIEQNLHQESSEKQRKDLNRLILKLKGSAMDIGALKTSNEVNKMIDFFKEGNMERFVASFEQVKIEDENLRVKMDPYFQLLEQEGSSGEEENPESLAVENRTLK